MFTLEDITVSWVSQLQKIVAFSSTKVEYIATTKASKEVIWLKTLIKELGKKQENSGPFNDN